MFCLLVRAPSFVGALDKRTGEGHHVIGSFSTDPGEDEIILKEENLRPEYSQTEDMATYDDFRLHGSMSNLRENKKDCDPIQMFTNSGVVGVCSGNCKCTNCVSWSRCYKCAMCVPRG